MAEGNEENNKQVKKDETNNNQNINNTNINSNNDTGEAKKKQGDDLNNLLDEDLNRKAKKNDEDDDLNILMDPDQAKKTDDGKKQNPTNREKKEENEFDVLAPGKGGRNIITEQGDERSKDVAVYIKAIKAFNTMYNVKISANDFAAEVSDAWELMKTGDTKKISDGRSKLREVFKNTLKQVFDVEKNLAFDENRLPEYPDIVNSTNELMRTAMFGFTDLYHNPDRKGLFVSTAYGGLNVVEMASLTEGKSNWDMDQTSNDAWKIQSQAARDLADKWLEDERPFETMINELKGLVDGEKNGKIDRKALYTKLAAAEWLLINDEKMMVEDPEDPYNKIPNWGNRYWKALTSTREALNIPKHTSMRELIQGDYAASRKAVRSTQYHQTQLLENVMNPKSRETNDSMDKEKERFATMSAAARLNEKEKAPETVDNNQVRSKIVVDSENEYKNMKNAVKDFSFIRETRTPKKTVEQSRSAK